MLDISEYPDKVHGIQCWTTGDSVNSIGTYAFAYCSSLTDVFYGGDNADWAAISIGTNNTYLTSASIHFNTSELQNASSGTLSSGVKWKIDEDGVLTLSGSGAIADYAFAENEDIVEVVIGDKVTSIGDCAFYFCENLEYVEFGSGLTSIGDYAFCCCYYLEEADLSDNITTIGDYAFYSCESLCSMSFNNVTTIGEGAFYDTGLDGDWVIGKSVTSIGDYALSYYEYENDPVLYDDIIIYGYTGTAAQTYAKKNGITFVALDPAAPTISSVSNTTTGVKITWKKVSGVTGYRVYRKAAGASSWTAIKSSTNSTSYTDTTAKSGTTYYYTVRAYVKANGTTYWGSYNKTGKSIKYLTAGKISSLTNTSKGITVKWSKVSGASGYKIYRKTSSGSYSLIKTITSGSTVSYTDTAVKSKNGTTYVYAVRPYSGSTMGSYTGKKIARLTAVSISSLTNVKTKKMTVKWGKNTKATGYQIQYSTSSSFSSGNKTVAVSSYKTASKTISSLTKGKKYYVRVRAYKTVSGTKYYSAWSGTKNVKISK